LKPPLSILGHKQGLDTSSDRDVSSKRTLSGPYKTCPLPARRRVWWTWYRCNVRWVTSYRVWAFINTSVS